MSTTTKPKVNTKESRVSFTLQVVQNESIVSSSGWEFPKQTKAVKGLQLTSDYPDKLYYRGSQRIEVGGEELFPDGFHSRMLMSSLAVAPRERFFDLGEVDPKDLSVKLRYKDLSNGSANFNGGYKVIATFLIEEAL